MYFMVFTCFNIIFWLFFYETSAKIFLRIWQISRVILISQNWTPILISFHFPISCRPVKKYAQSFFMEVWAWRQIPNLTCGWLLWSFVLSCSEETKLCILFGRIIYFVVLIFFFSLYMSPILLQFSFYLFQ